VQKLILTPAEGDSIEITRAPVIVGRDPAVAHIVVNDLSVSRQHAVIGVDATGWTVTDQGSSNGTFVDGNQIGACKIANGIELRFGAVAFLVTLSQPVRQTRPLPSLDARKVVAKALTGQTARVDPMDQGKVRTKPRVPGSTMRMDKAFEVLGLDYDATAPEVKSQHARLIDEVSAKLEATTDITERLELEQRIQAIDVAMALLAPRAK